VTGSCEHDNEHSDYIPSGKFLYWLSDYKLSRQRPAHWRQYKNYVRE
jgi:hypothetical protein